MEGNVLYMEFPSGDIDRAQRFWGGVLGWSSEAETEAFDYRMAQVGPDTGVALTPADEPGHPNVYIETADLDAALMRVRELGGEAGEIRKYPDASRQRYRRRPSTGASPDDGQRGERLASVAARVALTLRSRIDSY